MANELIFLTSATNYDKIDRLKARADGAGVDLFDSEGNQVGALGTDGQAFELVGTTDLDTANKAIRLQGSSLVLGSDNVAIEYTGAKVGEFLSLIAETDVDGRKYYTIGHTPLDVVVYREEFTNTGDVVLTGSDQIIVNGATTEGIYFAETSQANFSFVIENSSNVDTTIEYAVTRDGIPPLPSDIYTKSIPRRVSSSQPSVSEVIGQDTIDADVPLGSDVQLVCKDLGGGMLTAKGSVSTTSLEMVQNTSIAKTVGGIQAQLNDQDLITPSVADEVLIFDQSDGFKPKITSLREIISLAYIDAFISGSDNSGIITTATPTALTVFNNTTTFYSSSPILIKTVGDTGFTTLAPVRYEVTCSVTVRTGGTTDFFAQVYAGGLPCGEIQDISGDGNSKAVYSGITAFTHLLNINDTIELRIWDSGETINDIVATMKIRFAGSD